MPGTGIIPLSLKSFLDIGSWVVESSVRVVEGFQANFEVVSTSVREPPSEVQIIVVWDSPGGAASIASYNPPNTGDALRASCNSYYPH